MKVNNKIELVLENHTKCALHCDADCPLGDLYDYCCVLQATIVQKMQDLQKKPDEETPKEAA